MDAEEILRTLDEERDRAVALISGAASLDDLRDAEVQVLGKKAAVPAIQRQLGSLPSEDKRRVGQAVNEVFVAIREAIEERRNALESAREAEFAESDRIDVTLPGRRLPQGSLHVLTRTERLIVDTFVALGYRLLEGPEIETDWYNFEALNIPPDHPARTMQDTVYVDWPG